MSNEIGIIKHMWTAILPLDFMLQLKLKVAMGRHSIGQLKKKIKLTGKDTVSFGLLFPGRVGE